MKKRFVFVVFLIIAALCMSAQAYASFGTEKPFGGKIMITSSPGVTCAGVQYGPLTITPYGKSSISGPYVILAGKGNKGSPRSGGYILGKYSKIVNANACWTGEKPYDEPYEVYEITLYGVSK